MAEQAASVKAQAHTVLDVRPELEQGGEPFVSIMEAASAIKPGGTLVIIAPFEPVPLYDVLGAHGFSHETEKVAADEWIVQFTRSKLPWNRNKAVVERLCEDSLNATMKVRKEGYGFGHAEIHPGQ